MEVEVRSFYQYEEVGGRMIAPKYNEHFCEKCFSDWIESQEDE